MSEEKIVPAGGTNTRHKKHQIKQFSNMTNSP
jgi:hypothetical protein